MLEWPRFVAFDYQNTGIPDQTEEEPLIKAGRVQKLPPSCAMAVGLSITVSEAVYGVKAAADKMGAHHLVGILGGSWN